MNRNTIKSLNHLATFLVDEILSMTDVELLDELAADREDLQQFAQTAKSCFERARLQTRLQTSTGAFSSEP